MSLQRSAVPAPRRVCRVEFSDVRCAEFIGGCFLADKMAKGIGLGLMVCRNLVEADGGRIEVESEVGKGTTFSVVLPAERG